MFNILYIILFNKITHVLLHVFNWLQLGDDQKVDLTLLDSDDSSSDFEVDKVPKEDVGSDDDFMYEGEEQMFVSDRPVRFNTLKGHASFEHGTVVIEDNLRNVHQTREQLLQSTFEFMEKYFTYPMVDYIRNQAIELLSLHIPRSSGFEQVSQNPLVIPNNIPGSVELPVIESGLESRIKPNKKSSLASDSGKFNVICLLCLSIICLNIFY